MPTYQYRCTNCGEDLEIHQSFTDDPLTVCPACQGELRKVFSSVGIVFKGSGFYATDNRSKKPSALAPSSSTESSTSTTLAKPDSSSKTISTTPKKPSGD